VPLIVRAPHLPHSAGRRTSALVELVDVMPTLAELAGLPPPTVNPGEAPLDGISFVRPPPPAYLSSTAPPPPAGISFVRRRHTTGPAELTRES
jgi:arylsulfatase A-like enzyme